MALFTRDEYTDQHGVDFSVYELTLDVASNLAGIVHVDDKSEIGPPPEHPHHAVDINQTYSILNFRCSLNSCPYSFRELNS